MLSVDMYLKLSVYNTNYKHNLKVWSILNAHEKTEQLLKRVTFHNYFYKQMCLRILRVQVLSLVYNFYIKIIFNSFDNTCRDIFKNKN